MTRLRRAARPWTHARPEQNKCPPRGRPTASGSRAEVEGSEGVGGPHRSDDVGEPKATGPDRAKEARADINFRRET